MSTSRNLTRKSWARAELKPTNISALSEILAVETLTKVVLPRLEADIRLEYLPFAERSVWPRG